MFVDRRDGGERLAAQLGHLKGQDLVVLGLPRGGVPVAAVVAHELGAPLDVLVVRKLGAPAHPEYAVGAIGDGDARVLDREAMRMMGVSEEALSSVEQAERQELERRSARFRQGRAGHDLAGRVALIVDDGVATGSTAVVACRTARRLGASRVVFAVPVAPSGWTERLRDEADELVAVETPEPFFAVGQWYTDFAQTSDDEVIACLEAGGAARG